MEKVYKGGRNRSCTMGAPRVGPRSGNGNANRIQKSRLSVEEGCPHIKNEHISCVLGLGSHTHKTPFLWAPMTTLDTPPAQHSWLRIVNDRLFCAKAHGCLHAEYLQMAGETKMNKIGFPALHNLSYSGCSSRQKRYRIGWKRSWQVYGGVERKGKGLMEETPWTEHWEMKKVLVDLPMGGHSSSTVSKGSGCETTQGSPGSRQLPGTGRRWGRRGGKWLCYVSWGWVSTREIGEAWNR